MARALLITLLVTASLLSAGCTDAGGDGEMDNMTGEDPAPDVPAAPTPIAAAVTFSGFYGAPAGNTYTSTISVPQGSELTVTFENDDSNEVVSHDWYLEVLDVGTEVIGAGESASVTFIVDLEPGEYAYYCSVGNHRDNGMSGVLTVTAA